MCVQLINNFNRLKINDAKTLNLSHNMRHDVNLQAHMEKN